MKILKLIKNCLIMFFAYLIICNFVIYLYAQQQPIDNADTVVVLGAKVIGTPARPHPTLKKRLDIAVTYLQNNPQSNVVVCGGQGKDESATEASVMADYLKKHGIDSSRIYMEDQSARTAQQFIYANNILPLGQTVVITSDFHLLRSIMLAKRSGIDKVSGLSAPLDFANRDKYRALLREPLALINSWLFDHPKSDN